MKTKQTIQEHFKDHWQDAYGPYVKLKKAGKEYQGLCRFHQDTTPSLSIDPITGRWYCHACNEGGDFFDFYARISGLDVRRDFPAILDGIAQEFGIACEDRQETPKKKLVKTYDYKDETGALLYQSCRYEPKEFSFRRPDGHGGWIYDLEGVRRVPNNLPAVIKADEVSVVEGEKDVETLRRLGFTATCNRGGAGNWKSEDSEYLRGKKVFIFAHNDEPGRKHQQTVAENTYGIAAEVRTIPAFSELPKGGDITDELAGLSDEEARERVSIMLAEAQLWQPETTKIASAEPVTKKPLDLTFPNIMRGMAGAYAEAYSEISEVPKHFYYMAYLTCLGNAVAAEVRLQSLLNVQPRLYMIFLGLSGRGKKSTPIDITTSFFNDAFDDYGLMHYANSGEGLGVFLEKSPVTLLVYDEFMGFVSKASQKGNTLLGTVTSLFEKNQYQTATKDKQLLIEGAYLSMLAACTEDTWQRCWHTDFTAIGLINRLFLVPGGMDKKVSIPPPLDMQLRAELRTVLRDIVKNAKRIREYSLTASAAARYDQWYKNELDHKSIHSVRLDAYALRFMLLLTISRGLPRITEDTVEDTLKLINWEYNVRRLLDPVDADNETAKMETRIRRELLKGPRSSRDLQRNTQAHRTGLWLWKTALSNLKENKEVLYDSSSKTYFLAVEEE